MSIKHTNTSFLRLRHDSHGVCGKFAVRDVNGSFKISTLMEESFHITIVMVVTNTHREKISQNLRLYINHFIHITQSQSVVALYGAHIVIDNKYHQNGTRTKKKKERIGTTNRIRFECVDDKRPRCSVQSHEFLLVCESINLLRMQSTSFFGACDDSSFITKYLIVNYVFGICSEFTHFTFSWPEKIVRVPCDVIDDIINGLNWLTLFLNVTNAFRKVSFASKNGYSSFVRIRNDHILDDNLFYRFCALRNGRRLSIGHFLKEDFLPGNTIGTDLRSNCELLWNDVHLCKGSWLNLWLNRYNFRKSESKSFPRKSE